MAWRIIMNRHVEGQVQAQKCTLNTRAGPDCCQRNVKAAQCRAIKFELLIFVSPSHVAPFPTPTLLKSPTASGCCPERTRTGAKRYRDPPIENTLSHAH